MQARMCIREAQRQIVCAHSGRHAIFTLALLPCQCLVYVPRQDRDTEASGCSPGWCRNGCKAIALDASHLRSSWRELGRGLGAQCWWHRRQRPQCSLAVNEAAAACTFELTFSCSMTNHRQARMGVNTCRARRGRTGWRLKVSPLRTLRNAALFKQGLAGHCGSRWLPCLPIMRTRARKRSPAASPGAPSSGWAALHESLLRDGIFKQLQHVEGHQGVQAWAAVLSVCKSWRSVAQEVRVPGFFPRSMGALCLLVSAVGAGYGESKPKFFAARIFRCLLLPLLHLLHRSAAPDWACHGSRPETAFCAPAAACGAAAA